GGGPEGLDARHAEGHLVRVDRVVLAVVHLGRDVDHGVPGEDAPAQGLLDALVDRGDELAGDGAPLDRVDELVARAAGPGREADEGDAELAAATGLLLVLALGLGAGGDRLPVGDLGQLVVDLHPPHMRWIRSRGTSTWLSPSPARMVSPVSGRLSTRIVGSSSVMRERAIDSLSSS